MSNRMNARDPEFVGLIPAAGVASRLPQVDSSKELLPVPTGPNGENVEPVICHLLRSFRKAGIAATKIVLRDGKDDILEYLGNPEWDDLGIDVVITPGTAGVPQTVALGLEDTADANILFGFPDILFEPTSAFENVATKLVAGAADIVLGAFPTTKPHKMDMLQTASDGSVIAIDIKPAETALEFAWLIAAWSPTFTQYFLNLVNNASGRMRNLASDNDSLHFGHALQLALGDDIRIAAELFPGGRSLDIGTPDDLDAARHWFDSAGER